MEEVWATVEMKPRRQTRSVLHPTVFLWPAPGSLPRKEQSWRDNEDQWKILRELHTRMDTYTHTHVHTYVGTHARTLHFLTSAFFSRQHSQQSWGLTLDFPFGEP